MVESDSIPFERHDLRGERLLVLAPHPDDEAIGCGGVVAQHLRDGRAVRVVVVTDGGEAEASTDPQAYRAEREAESRQGLDILGSGAELEFLRIPDRRLPHHAGIVADRIAAELRIFRPDLILVTSPIEIHPDHRELGGILCQLLQRDESLFAQLAVARVAFYEVGQPVRPNALVDITDVADLKYAAIAAHRSQTRIRDYVALARGLNAYRAMTLPADTKSAEAYYVVDVPRLRTTPLSRLQHDMGDARGVVQSVAEPLPISVIVRTRNRPALLREAIESIRSTGYPAEIVVVNDGGASVEVEGATLVDHQISRGRSEAANSGVRAAGSRFIAFLDDDDLYYPEHLTTISNAARSGLSTAWYSDAVSTFVAPGDSGSLQTRSRMRIFEQDFDRDLLLIDNYIPLPTVLLDREAFLSLGGFDPAFDLFEDWEFLIRLSARGDFARVPRITCEIRHIQGAGSITLSAPEGSSVFREAKLQVWRKHADRITNDVFAAVFEKQKRRALDLSATRTETAGLLSLREQAVATGQREKRALIAELQALNERLNEAVVRASNLDGTLSQFRQTNDELRGMLGAAQNERNELLVRVGELERFRAAYHDVRAAYDDANGALSEAQRTITALYAEIARLQSLLDMIYESRTWKLHTIMERMKGRR